MITDHYANTLTTASQTAAAHYDTGVKALLGSQFGAHEAMAAALQADPSFALAHIGLARAHMSSADMPAARAAISAAQALAENATNKATEREQAHIHIHHLLAMGQGQKARKLAEAHILTHPRDALVAQLCTSVFGLIAFSGCHGTEPQMLAYTSALLPHYSADDWWIKSVHATSLCENGLPEHGLALMERSLELNPNNANGAHFKSHALYELGQTSEGLSYLQDWVKPYDRRAVLHGHLRWHIALWALAQGDTKTMWAEIDASIAPEANLGLPINVLTDTAALYYRAELAGHSVSPERWQSLSTYAAKCYPNAGQSFADLHSALAHAMAGNTGGLASYFKPEHGYASDIVTQTAKAWGAIAQNDWAAAVTHLTPVMSQTARFGGSRAQRDLLEFTYVNALLKSGATVEAKRLLQTRRPAQFANAPIAALTEATRC